MLTNSPIAYALAGKGKQATLSYHPMAEDWVPSPWDCADSDPLTMHEASGVLATHSTCGAKCRISRAARKVRALHIDAPTVRVDIPASIGGNK